MDEIVIEFALWIITVCLTFIVLNRYLNIRTAASLVLSLIVSSILIFIIYKDLFAEVVLSLSSVIAFLYAIVKALRDFRDDVDPRKSELN